MVLVSFFFVFGFLYSLYSLFLSILFFRSFFFSFVLFFSMFPSNNQTLTHIQRLLTMCKVSMDCFCCFSPPLFSIWYTVKIFRIELCSVVLFIHYMPFMYVWMCILQLYSFCLICAKWFPFRQPSASLMIHNSKSTVTFE